MTDMEKEGRQGKYANEPGSLKGAVETLKKRFSSITVETLVADRDTALSVHFVGDERNLQERRLLVNNLVRYLPPALSVLGVRQEQKQSSEDTQSSSSSS